MTNREMLNACTNYELAYIFYNNIIKEVGLRYMSTVPGVGDWLNEEANQEQWSRWKKAFWDFNNMEIQRSMLADKLANTRPDNILEIHY